MRPFLVCLLVLGVVFARGQAQDTLSGLEILYKQSQIKEEGIKHERLKLTNYYGPFHQTIKDSSVKTISDIGVYLSGGIGNLADNIVSCWAGMFSGSLAYKSHLLSITYNAGKGNGEIKYWPATYYATLYKETCYGFMVGECIRYKHGMLSLSTGIAFSGSSFSSTIPSNYYNIEPNYNRQGKISLPIELKVFLLAYNGVGLGLHFTEVIIFQQKNTPIYFGLCMVTGFWNKPKKQPTAHN